MKRTCVLLTIGCVSLIGFSARAAQAQTAAEAPIALPATTVTVTTSTTTPTAATPTASTQDAKTVAQGKTVAQNDRSEVSVKKPAFVRMPMTSRIFPSMWQ
jgi:hypothetical protein